MPETEWNSTTVPEEGAVVYVLAADDHGQYKFHSRWYSETIAGGTLRRDKSLMFLSRDGDLANDAEQAPET